MMPWSGSRGFRPPGEATAHALGEIRRGMRLYQVYLVVGLVGSLALLAWAGSTGIPQFVGVPTLPWVGGALTPTSTAPPTQSGGGPVVQALELVGLLIVVSEFAFILVAWLTWRSGVRDLPYAIFEFGADACARARAAADDYRRTLLSVIASLLVGIGLTVAVVVFVVELVVGGYDSAPGPGTPSAAQLTDFRLEFLAVVVGGIVLAGIVGFVMYYFATRSLVRSLEPVARPAQREALASGRRWVLVGGALTPLSLLALIHPLLELVGLLPPVVILLGFSRMLGAYDTFLASPARPGRAPVGALG